MKKFVAMIMVIAIIIGAEGIAEQTYYGHLLETTSEEVLPGLYGHIDIDIDGGLACMKIVVVANHAWTYVTIGEKTTLIDDGNAQLYATMNGMHVTCLIIEAIGMIYEAGLL